MHFAGRGEAGEAAIGAGDDVLAPDRLGEAADAFGINSGCSTMFEEWVMTPGMTDLPSGNFTSAHTFHSCSWRGFAASKE